jgi:biopolymer transport protein ExbB/TolQ
MPPQARSSGAGAEMNRALARHAAAAASPVPQPIRRVLNRPLVLSLSLAAAVAMVTAMDVLLPSPLAAMLLDKGRSTYPVTVQTIMWIVFALGVGELVLRARDASAERGQLRAGYLPEDVSTVLTRDDMRRLWQLTREATRPGAPGEACFLPRLINRVVTLVQHGRPIEQADSLLAASVELYLHEVDLRYSLIRYVIWAIPTLGFIGTVIGISLALNFAGQVDLQDPNLLAELTKRLAVAFDTTLLALLMSAVLVLAQHVVQAGEERALNTGGQYVLDNLVNRLHAGN